MFWWQIVSIVVFSLTAIECTDLLNYRASPRMMGPSRIAHADDVTLKKLDDSLSQISSVHMQALFAGTHTPALDTRMRQLEMDLFDQLDSLYKQHRLNDYMKYEAEVTRQMIIYNMLKKVFGYTLEDNAKV